MLAVSQRWGRRCHRSVADRGGGKADWGGIDGAEVRSVKKGTSEKADGVRSFRFGAREGGDGKGARCRTRRSGGGRRREARRRWQSLAEIATERSIGEAMVSGTQSVDGDGVDDDEERGDGDGAREPASHPTIDSGRRDVVPNRR
ncbi:hypothetical protein COCNU_scaffold013027G000020 [Cocos nucifera]|nr:hypothetical protein [Cocos nucifera]